MLHVSIDLDLCLHDKDSLVQEEKKHDQRCAYQILESSMRDDSSEGEKAFNESEMACDKRDSEDDDHNQCSHDVAIDEDDETNECKAFIIEEGSGEEDEDSNDNVGV